MMQPLGQPNMMQPYPQAYPMQQQNVQAFDMVTMMQQEKKQDQQARIKIAEDQLSSAKACAILIFIVPIIFGAYMLHLAQLGQSTMQDIANLTQNNIETQLLVDAINALEPTCMSFLLAYVFTVPFGIAMLGAGGITFLLAVCGCANHLLTFLYFIAGGIGCYGAFLAQGTCGSNYETVVTDFNKLGTGFIFPINEMSNYSIGIVISLVCICACFAFAGKAQRLREVQYFSPY
jgi:hypothetical protein